MVADAERARAREEIASERARELELEGRARATCATCVTRVTCELELETRARDERMTPLLVACARATSGALRVALRRDDAVFRA